MIKHRYHSREVEKKRIVGWAALAFGLALAAATVIVGIGRRPTAPPAASPSPASPAPSSVAPPSNAPAPRPRKTFAQKPAAAGRPERGAGLSDKGEALGGTPPKGAR